MTGGHDFGGRFTFSTSAGTIAATFVEMREDFVVFDSLPTSGTQVGAMYVRVVDRGVGFFRPRLRWVWADGAVHELGYRFALS